MKAPALLILLLFSSLALAQQQYYGTKAATVVLPAPADQADLTVLTLHEGDIITLENIRSSIQALYNTGHYRTISADAVAGPEGTQVSFIVTPQCYFSTIRLEPGNLLDRPITSYSPPPFGKKYSTAPIDRLVTEAVNLLEEAGYFNASITHEDSCDPESRLETVILKADVSKERAKIRSIQIGIGQQIFSDSELHRTLKVSEGDDFNADKVDKGVARIRQKFVDKGYLTAKIQVVDRAYDAAMNAVDLKITIDPGKTITVRVSESGGAKSEIADAKLRTLVPIFEEGTVDADLKEEGRVNIEGYYKQQGFFDATATFKEIVEADQSVHVDYLVLKGERHRVRTLQIEGNAFFTEAEILKKMKTSEGKSASHGLFSPDLLTNDVRVIEAMYQNAGFRSTAVSQEHTDSNGNIDITIQIREGLRSTLNAITFSGNQSFPEPELWREAGIQSDQVYSATIIDNARAALANFYFTKGFSEVRVESHLYNIDSENNTLDVQFDITEGPKYRIGRIFVAGNTHTAEPVITRAGGLKSYDPYNPEALLQAQQKLYSMGIFNRVEVVTIERDQRDLGMDKNLLIQVEEAKPILLTPGFGVTDRDGPRATIELSDINWLGRAKTISARVRGGRNERQFQASYRDPRLFNHDLEGIASLSFDKTTHNDAKGNLLYNSNETDFSIQTVRKLSKTRTLSFSASYETVNLQDIKVNPNIRRFPDTPGLIQIARLGSTYIEDRRDSVSDPTHGTFLTTSLEIANKKLGSEVNFGSLFTQGSYFTPVRGGVIASSVRLGWKHPYGGDVELPISERFFTGGSTTLRGFKFDDAGPQGGGQLLTIGNIEYRVPLPFLPIKGLGTALFYDTGNVFERPSDFELAQFTHSAGTGLRYKTPIGPVRVDVGFNLRAKTTERRYRVFFTLGHAF